MVNKKFEMTISKWNLIKVMTQLKPIEIKRVMQLLMRQPDPVNASVHALIIALVLTRREMNSENKVKAIF